MLSLCLYDIMLLDCFFFDVMELVYLLSIFSLRPSSASLSSASSFRIMNLSSVSVPVSVELSYYSSMSQSSVWIIDISRRPRKLDLSCWKSE